MNYNIGHYYPGHPKFDADEDTCHVCYELLSEEGDVKVGDTWLCTHCFRIGQCKTCGQWGHTKCTMCSWCSTFEHSDQQCIRPTCKFCLALDFSGDKTHHAIEVCRYRIPGMKCRVCAFLKKPSHYGFTCPNKSFPCRKCKQRGHPMVVCDLLKEYAE
jgi:hypothetical protein